MSLGKCPKCESKILNVTVEDIDIRATGGGKWRGFSYLCPKCKTILSVQMNPLALNVDLVKDIKGK